MVRDEKTGRYHRVVVFDEHGDANVAVSKEGTGRWAFWYN